MMDHEHPTNQPIKAVTVTDYEGCTEHYEDGKHDTCLIEPFTKSGMYAAIPYIRVWKKVDGAPIVHAEFCQHNIVGVYFDKPIF